MNMAAYRGVYLWDVAQDGAGKTMKAAGGSLSILEACAEKTGCVLEILGWGGLPAALRRFHGRQMLAAGILLFAGGLYALSSFIWVVDVEGNERLPSEEVLEACRKMGLRPGAWKRSVDVEEITNGLLEGFSDISWASVSLKGTDAVIRLAETIEKAEIVDKETPCDIVAAQDGVILRITAERGTPVVSEGDVVKRGDVLISSEVIIGLEGEEQHPEYVAAEGAVTARVWLRLAEDAPLAYEEIVYDGEEKENDSLIFDGRELDFIHPNDNREGKEWEKKPVFERPLALGDFELPFKWKKEEWRSFARVRKTRTVEEAKTLLEENLRKKTENLLSIYGTIEGIEIQYQEYADSVHAEATATLRERIGEQQTTEKEWEAEDGTI